MGYWLGSLNLNKKWAEALLIASRSLRQNVLKGRIWGDGDTNEEHLGSSNTHLEPGDETILFSTDDTTPNAKRSTLKNSKSPTPSRESRSRNSPRPLPNVPSPVPTPQRSRSQRGKVRGMVETFERSGSFSSETGDEDDMDLERGFSRSGFGKGLGGPNGRGVSISGTPNSADAARNGNGFDESQNQSSPPPLPGGFSRKWIRELRHARAPSGGEVIRDDEDDEDAVFMIPGSRGSSSMKAQRQTQGEQRESLSPTRSSPERRPLPAIPRAKTAPITVVPITTSVVTEFGEVPSKVGKRGEGGEQELTMEELLAAAGDEGLSASWGARAWEEVDLKNGVTVKRIADYQPRPSPSHRKGKISEDSGVGVCGEFGLRREEDGGEEEGLATIVGPGSNGRVRGYGSRAGGDSGRKGKARAKEERGVVTALFDPISSPASQGIRIAKDTEVRGVVGEEPSQRSTVDVAVCQTLEHVKRTVDIGIETDKVPLEIESKVPQVENVQEDAEELLKLTAELLRTRALVETFRTRLGFLEGKIASLEEDEVKYLAEQAALQLSPADVRCERLDAGVQANESQENRPGSPAHAHQGTDARPESTTADVTVQVDSHPAHASVRTHAGVQAEDPSELESSQADEDFQDAVDSEDPPLVDFDSVSPVLANGLATPTNSNSKFPEIGSASVVSQATSYLPTFLQNLSSTPLPPDSTLSPPELTAEEKEKSLSLEDRKKDDPEPSTMSELSHYVLMVGIGVCVVALRVMLKRAGGRGGRV